jgi:hypothetical protein
MSQALNSGLNNGVDSDQNAGEHLGMLAVIAGASVITVQVFPSSLPA